MTNGTLEQEKVYERLIGDYVGLSDFIMKNVDPCKIRGKRWPKKASEMLINTTYAAIKYSSKNKLSEEECVRIQLLDNLCTTLFEKSLHHRWANDL